MFSALEVWLLTGAILLVTGWNLWQEARMQTARRDLDHKIDDAERENRDLDKRLTVLETTDTPDYRELMNLITPLERKIDAIAIKVGAEPDRRHDD